jgi:hypothetical protein
MENGNEYKMMDVKRNFLLGFVLFLLVLGGAPVGATSLQTTLQTASLQANEERPIITLKIQEHAVARLVAAFGEGQRMRLEQGVRQMARFWRKGDGNAAAFERFARTNFATAPQDLSRLFQRVEKNLEAIQGNFLRITRSLCEPFELDIGPMLAIDEMFAAFSPFNHLLEDLFAQKIAFLLLLNFPAYSLEEKIALGPTWSREEWARARMMDLFKARVPSAINQHISETAVETDRYVNQYNIFIDNLLDAKNTPRFTGKGKLISHWGLRDEIKAQYGQPEALAKQDLIYRCMLRIIDGSIPRAVINNPDLLWNPMTNTVQGKSPAAGQGKPPAGNQRTEGTGRYEKIHRVFQAQKAVDRYYPQAPSLIARKFQVERQIGEQEFEALLVSIVSSPVAAGVGRHIAAKLGRPLRPFDIWFAEFKPGRETPETELDALTRERYPTVASFQADLPRLLENLGFTASQTGFLCGRITVDPSRGAGHALGPMMKNDSAHLRTRVPAEGMNYKGYNIAIHELGHNCEQVFSLPGIDHYFLGGVPNSAFTECWAFVFQSRDLKLLGKDRQNALDEHFKTLQIFWNTFEISGVALTDMRVWRWLYEHPDASPAELQQAVQQIARDVWNQYYAPILGEPDCPILAIYSHMLSYPLYLPDYPLGYIISYQVEEFLRTRNLGAEMERMCRQGLLTPQLWMQQAAGTGISTQPLLTAAATALQKITSK